MTSTPISEKDVAELRELHSQLGYHDSTRESTAHFLKLAQALVKHAPALLALATQSQERDAELTRRAMEECAKASQFDRPANARALAQQPTDGDKPSVARAVREEIVRQYRDDERSKCPAGADFYEEYIAPEYIVRATPTAAAQAGEEKPIRHTDRSVPCPTCGFVVRTRERQPFVIEDDLAPGYEGERVEPSLLAASIVPSLSASRQGEPSPATPPGRVDDYDSAKALETSRRLLPHTIAGIRRAEEKVAERRQATPAPTPLGRADDGCGGHAAEELDKLLADHFAATPAQSGAGEARNITGLTAIAAVIRSWIDWDKAHRDKEFLITDGDTAIMSLPVPFWPSHACFENWISTMFESDARIVTLTQALAEAEKVIEPFAERAKFYDDKKGFSPTPDYAFICQFGDTSGAPLITAGHLRAARAWLERRRAEVVAKVGEIEGEKRL